MHDTDQNPAPETHAPAIAAFELAYPDLFWTVAKGRIRADEPLYGAVISTEGMTDIGEGESNVSAEEAFRLAVEDAGLDLPVSPPANPHVVAALFDWIIRHKASVLDGMTKREQLEFTEAFGTARATLSAATFIPTHRHKKRGSQYQVMAHGRLQVDADLDMEKVTIYRAEDGSWWVRPDYEFNDGRFEPIATAAEASE